LKTIVLMPAYRIAKFWDQIACYLYQMDPQPDKWIFSEHNGPDDTIYKLAQFKRPHELIRFWVRRDANLYMDTPYDIIAIARQFLLQRARQLDPDWAVFIDTDMEVLSPNLLDVLTSHEVQVDIVGASYPKTYNPKNLQLACVGPMISKDALFMKAPTGMWDTWLAAIGGGCMALSRRILQDRRLNFYPVRRPELGFKTAEDSGYCFAARRLGYVIGLDSSVKLRHLNRTILSIDRPWIPDRNGKMPIFEFSTGIVDPHSHTFVIDETCFKPNPPSALYLVEFRKPKRSG